MSLEYYEMCKGTSQSLSSYRLKYAPEDVNDHFHRPGIISRVGFEVVEGHDLHYDLADAGEVKMKGKHLRYAIEAKFGTFEDTISKVKDATYQVLTTAVIRTAPYTRAKVAGNLTG